MVNIVETTEQRRALEMRGKSPEAFQGIMSELERISRTREDWVVPASAITMRWNAVDSLLKVDQAPGAGAVSQFPVSYNVGRIAHEQIADKMGIPQKYYQRMAGQAPELLTTNVNHWMGEESKNYLCRYLDGKMRAFLSDRYRTLDDYDFALHIGQGLRDSGAMISELTLSEERFHIRALQPNWGVDIGGGDVLIPGLYGSNSSVGRGGLEISGYLFRTVCSNGAMTIKGLHRIHLGERRESGLQLAADTQAARDEAMWLEVRDLVHAVFDKTLVAEMVESVQDAAQTMLAEPIKAVETVAAKMTLNEQQKNDVLAYMMAPQIPATEAGTLWGLVNGITQLGHKSDAEEEVRLQRIGGELLEKGREMVAVRR